MSDIERGRVDLEGNGDVLDRETVLPQEKWYKKKEVIQRRILAGIPEIQSGVLYDHNGNEYIIASDGSMRKSGRALTVKQMKRQARVNAEMDKKKVK